MTHKIKRCFWLIVATMMICVLFTLSSCEWAAYNRLTYAYDPNNGTWVLQEEVHAGRLSAASDIDLSKLKLKAGDRELSLDQFKEEQDKVKVTAITPIGPVSVESEN